jgi:hypothetical protein
LFKTARGEVDLRPMWQLISENIWVIAVACAVALVIGACLVRIVERIFEEG